jgi:Reverse transcriptase (RNA-dependent DNA polymerase)
MRQGGVLSPWLFNQYIQGLLREVVNAPAGCSIAGLVTNILAYADDLVLLALSWEGLQYLLNILASHCKDLDMTVNVKKLSV